MSGAGAFVVIVLGLALIWLVMTGDLECAVSAYNSCLGSRGASGGVPAPGVTGTAAA